MTITISKAARLLMFSVAAFGMMALPLSAQPEMAEVTGTVIESGTGLPLAQVAVSDAATGTTAISDEEGKFSLVVPNLQAQLIINLPGYNSRRIYLNGRQDVRISLVSEEYHTGDNLYNNPLGAQVIKDVPWPVQKLTKDDLSMTSAASFDQTLQGQVPGLMVIEQSGMPGHRTFMNIRGYNSLYANQEPLLFIDGMIHSYAYAVNSLMEGFSLNPMDVVDVEDISDISVLKDGLSYLGAAGSNGAIYVNTEQKAEASTIIKFAAQGGITMTPQYLELMNPGQFNTYFEEILTSQGYSSGDIDAMYPWLRGNESAEGYYKYNNDTDWQDEIYKPATMSKFHFFLKGGDDIATYNISTGYLRQNGIYDASRYNRFNLRINGRVNITDKFSVTPNAKLSLADSQLANQGPSAWKSPTLSAVMKSPNMHPIARDAATGEYLTYYDDVGVFNVSNPSALVANAMGDNRNYHFLSSLKANYQFNEHFNLYTLIGLNFNNARESIFLPNQGVVQVDSAYNSPGDFVNEFRSTQNHTALTYSNTTSSGHSILANVGFRYLVNNYKYNLSTDLNTPSDDFRSLGDGSQYSFLRSTVGDNRELAWVSYFGDAHYSFRNKYFLSASLSYDGNSATNEQNRYNFYPSAAAAWRLSSEPFMNGLSWLDDLRLRGSYSITGNMFSTVYDYSKLFYTDHRINSNGMLTREAIPNENLELEKKNTINAGLDLSAFNQTVNLHANYFISNVDNLVIRQELPSPFGFTNYFDNGGQMQTTGIEAGLDVRVQSGNFTWIIGGTFSQVASEITALDLLNEQTESIVTSITGAQYVTEVGGPLNAFYGFETDGLVSAGEAGSLIGPKGLPMQEGDVKFVDQDGNNIINEADKTVIGDPNPDMYGSLFTSLSFGSLELYARFNFFMGNDVYNYVRYNTESMSDYSNQSTTVLDRWTSSNTGAELPRASYGDPTGNTMFSDRWIEDGTYFRLDQLTISYHLNSIAGLFNGVTLYITGTNLLTFTDYSGYDPEFQYKNSPFYQGVDYGMMPLSRSFIAGLKLNL